MPLSQGTVLNNRYCIARLLGQGGFGAVYLAWDQNLKTRCAVKENLETEPEAQNQFIREAIILARLQHPNLPGVREHFFEPNQKGQYLVMDFIEGKDLEKILERTGKPLPEKQVLVWARQICNALEYMHSQIPPVIHRDIKPANIKITPDGKAVLVDFGIAKTYSPTKKTTKGAKAVTPGYSPPEQYGRGLTDARSDIYALGATLYTLLTGQIPPESVRRIASTDNLIPVHRLNPTVSPHVSEAIRRSLQIEQNQRFQRATDFQSALQGNRVPIAAPVRRGQIHSQSLPPTYVPSSSHPVSVPSPKTSSGTRRKPLGTIIALLVFFVGLFAWGGSVVSLFASNTNQSRFGDDMPVVISDNDESNINSNQGEIANSSASLPTQKLIVPSPTPISNICPGAPPIRVKVGDHVHICVQSGIVYFRTAPNASADHLYKLIPGAELDIIGGPKCDANKGWWYWKAKTESGTIGWIAEGGDEIDPYFICP